MVSPFACCGCFLYYYSYSILNPCILCHKRRASCERVLHLGMAKLGALGDSSRECFTGVAFCFGVGRGVVRVKAGSEPETQGVT